MEFYKATTKDDFTGAYKCLYRCYLGQGLIKPNDKEQHLIKRNSQTETFIAKDKEVVATLSVTFPPVPMSTIFGPEVANLKGSVCEAGGLAICVPGVRSIHILDRLIGLVAVASHKRNIDNVLICVHPTHKDFYINHYRFTQFTDVKPYETVLGALAVGLYVNLPTLPLKTRKKYLGF